MSNAVSRGSREQRLSLLIQLRDEPGALARGLMPFTRHEVNLTHIESRPARGGTFDFYVDCEGVRGDGKVEAVIRQLEAIAVKLLVLDHRQVPWFPRYVAELDLIANNTLDAAVALSSLGELGNATPPEGYGTPKSETVAASLGQQVQKFGRTTSLTTGGTITGINATLNIGYGAGTARFVDQIIVETRKPRFIQGGDSGSLLVIQGGADDRKPVGLLYAGTSTGKMAIANHIDAVLSRFNVSIDGEGAAPAPTPTPDPTATPDPNATPTPTPTATPTPPPSTGDMGVHTISWNSKKKNLQFTITIRQDSNGDNGLSGADSPVVAAHVNATLTYDSNGNGVIEACSVDTCYSNFGGDTGSNGSVKFSLVGGAPMGLYQAEVTGLTHATLVWNTALDADNPDTLTR